MSKDPSITFWGAARGVTGSRHLLRFDGRQVLLDCGLFQGRRKESEKLNRELPFDPGELDAVVLSHAHIDHSGNLPSLARNKFHGKVYCTPATADLLSIMLRDSASIQERDAAYLNKRLKKGQEPVRPLYEMRDVESLLERIEPRRYRKPFEVCPGLTCTYLDAGHILGSTIVQLELARENEPPLRIVFSGDLGRKHLPILKDPEVVKEADVLLLESTYGNRLHDDIRGSEERLGAIVKRTAARGGKVIIPSFSVGRSQEIVYELNELFRNGDIPEIPIYIDSPLTVKASNIFAKHEECFDAETWEIIQSGEDPFGFNRMHYIEKVADSKRLNLLEEPCVIISASGMAEAGRILHHLKNNIEDPRSTILIVGFQAYHTLGRRLEEGAKEVRIFGVTYPVRAEVCSLHAFSAHADRDDLLGFVDQMDTKPRQIFLVHGEEEASFSLSKAFKERGLPDVRVPKYGEQHSLG